RRRLHIAIGFAEISRRGEAPPLLKRALPEPARQDFIITDVGHRPRRLLLLYKHKAPAHRHDLALTVRHTAHDGRNVTREDRAGRFECGGAVMRDAKEARHHVPLFIQGVEVAHSSAPHSTFPPSMAVVLDGELTVCDQDGNPDFSSLLMRRGGWSARTLLCQGGWPRSNEASCL